MPADLTEPLRGVLRHASAAQHRVFPEAGKFSAAGFRDVVQLAGRRAGVLARGALRSGELKRQPLRAQRGELEAALGDLSLRDALSGPVMRAMPTVDAFERSLGEMDDEARRSVLSRGDAVVAHVFDLLGSGPTNIGPEIDWSSDFKVGRRWPMKHIAFVPAVYADDSDIKIPWELSRCQHLPLLSAAFRLSRDRAYLRDLQTQLESWIEANPVEFGPNWLCTMDVAIRAANWVAALAICADDVAHEPWCARVGESLLMHGRFIRNHLETGEVRSNHYLSNIVGLLVVGSLFAAGREGSGWVRWASAELVKEMDHQVRQDGCDHEVSISYHRLVSELFVCGTQVVQALEPACLPAWYTERLGRMLDFVADYTRPDGLAPQVGDADDGRFLPLGDYGSSDTRCHLHLFRQAGRHFEQSTSSAAYPHGGFYVLRSGDLYVLVRCGDTGMYGRGGHAHNDQLSFELCWGHQPMVVDPGAYAYTADPSARNLFRSTEFHATLRIDEAQQNPIGLGTLFDMGDRTAATQLGWRVDVDRTIFEGRHHGYAALPCPAIHTRRFQLDTRSGLLEIRDEVLSDGRHLLEWTFPLADCRACPQGSVAVAEFDESRLVIEGEDVEFAVEDGWYSPSYGVRRPTPFFRARRQSKPGVDVARFRLRVEHVASRGL